MASADYLTFKTAAGVAVRGLILHVVLTCGLLVYSILARDFAALTATIFVAVGAVCWLLLAILYDQHRRERIEAMEAQAMASAGGDSSRMFSQEDLRPAARRLAGLHTYLVPIVSISCAVVLVGLGVFRFMQWESATSVKNYMFVAPGLPGAGLGAGLVMAVVAFVFARYAAGMAKQPAWANLRAGAAFSAGAALLGIGKALAVMVDYVGPDTGLRIIPQVFAIFLVVVGVEVALQFVLGIYRPRRAGQIPQVSLDSRLLGFVAAPDRVARSISEAINYQLGFDITGGWFYQLLSRTVLPLVGVGVLIVWGLSAFAVVQPHQRAIVLRFGEPVGAELEPGLHLKAPWPIDTLYVPEYIEQDAQGRIRVKDRTVTGLRELELGTRTSAADSPILWTNEHPGEEVYQFVRASAPSERAATSATIASEGGVAAGADGRRDELVDLAIVSVELPLHYIVTDVRAFDELATPENRDELLQAIAVRETTRYFQEVHLDQVLGFGRREISDRLRERIQEAFDQLNPVPGSEPRGAGVRVVYVGVSGVHPPRETAPAFERTVQADARRIANVQAAQADAVRTLTQVVGNADAAGTIVQELEALERLPAPTDEGARSQVAAQQTRVMGLIENAGGQAASLLAQARAERWVRHMEARGRAARYVGQVALYEAAPEVFLGSAYFDSMREVMDRARLFVVGEGVGTSWYQVDGTDKDVGADVFRPQGEGP